MRWSLGAPGLAVLDADGWTTIPFAELPEDLTSFPPELQKAITARRSAPVTSSTRTVFVTFTDKDGTKYDNVRATLGARGVHVLTHRGWTTLSAAQLPNDLSPFPPEWRPALLAPPSATARRSVTQVVSFTTRKGKLYTDVQAAIEDKGLRLLTWDGWIAVPFDQLPEDLSSFPEGWREKILQKRAKLHSASAAH